MRGLERFEGFAPSRTSAWDALTRAIVYQQLHGNAARAIHARVCALGARGRFPTAARLADLDDESLRACGLSAAKLAALRDLARHVLDRRLPITRLARLSDDEVIERISQVRGLGRWSAQMFLMTHLGRLDVMPSGDLGVREGVRLLDALDERPSPKEVEERGERWRPLRSVASWYLWRLVESTRAAAKVTPPAAPASSARGTRSSRGRSRPSAPR